MFQKENCIYYVQIKRGKKISLETRNHDTARHRFNKLQREQWAGKLLELTGDSKSKTTLEDFATEYKEWAQETKPKSTFNADRLALDQLIKVHGNTVLISSLNQKHLDQVI
ncbi:MAG TPA: hypothetical protein VKN82_06090 [Desulfohalobiaceae bacterium]|nr:hypothetical protein [Desulfohalobiaceae bacterium]